MHLIILSSVSRHWTLCRYSSAITSSCAVSEQPVIHQMNTKPEQLQATSVGDERSSWHEYGWHSSFKSEFWLPFSLGSFHVGGRTIRIQAHRNPTPLGAGSRVHCHQGQARDSPSSTEQFWKSSYDCGWDISDVNNVCEKRRFWWRERNIYTVNYRIIPSILNPWACLLSAQIVIAMPQSWDMLVVFQLTTLQTTLAHNLITNQVARCAEHIPDMYLQWNVKLVKHTWAM